MPRYYNIHTHHNSSGADCLAIQNMSRHFDRLASGAFYSAGLHPWYLGHTAEELPLLKQAARLPAVIALGECGLDRLKGAHWEAQTAAFEAQIILANTVRKPLIIHCVRAYDEVLRMLKEQQVSVPVIFHGFNRKPAIAARVLSAGYYLSFGAAILQDRSAAALVLPQIPGDRFFLETDDAPVTIQEIYSKAAAIRKTDEDALILQMEQNFKNLFSI